MNEEKKIDVIDLIISRLSEHEKNLSELIDRLTARVEDIEAEIRYIRGYDPDPDEDEEGL